MWCLPNDSSKAVITAAEQINGAHRECRLRLPETAVLFFMSKGTDYLIEHYNTEEMAEPLVLLNSDASRFVSGLMYIADMGHNAEKVLGYSKNQLDVPAASKLYNRKFMQNMFRKKMQ